jgi:hypothetical protein
MDDLSKILEQEKARAEQRRTLTTTDYARNQRHNRSLGLPFLSPTARDWPDEALGFNCDDCGEKVQKCICGTFAHSWSVNTN